MEGTGNAMLSGVISGTGTLAKDGAGTLTLSSSGNTFTGKSFLHGGTVAFGRDDHLGAAPAALIADQLTIDGGTLRATDNVGLSANRGTTLGIAGGTLAVDGGWLSR
jgi:autotransporter-associated beta strand protein